MSERWETVPDARGLPEAPMPECVCPACEITTFDDIARRERVYIRGLHPECPVHGAPTRSVYIGTDGGRYPTRAEAGWNDP